MEIFNYLDVGQLEAAKAQRVEQNANDGNIIETALKPTTDVQKPEREHIAGKGLRGSHVFLLHHPQPAL